MERNQKALVAAWGPIRHNPVRAPPNNRLLLPLPLPPPGRRRCHRPSLYPRRLPLPPLLHPKPCRPRPRPRPRPPLYQPCRPHRRRSRRWAPTPRPIPTGTRRVARKVRIRDARRAMKTKARPVRTARALVRFRRIRMGRPPYQPLSNSEPLHRMLGLSGRRKMHNLQRLRLLGKPGERATSYGQARACGPSRETPLVRMRPILRSHER